MQIFFLFLFVFGMIGVYGQNETEVMATEVTLATDPRCLPGCTFESNLLDSATLKYFPKNCSTVCSSLYIGYETDLTEKQMNDTLKNMKHLIGDLLVNRSKFKSGRFLASLETVDCYNYGFFKWSLNNNLTEINLPNLTNVSCRVEIKANSNLTNLNLPKMIPTQSLTVNYSLIDVEISFNSPEFCITLQEMSNLMTHDYIKFDLITGTFCDAFNNSTSSEKKTCDLINYTWSEMHSGCVHVLGDVLIDQDNEEHAHMLESVESIFGSLIIVGTNLTDTSFLGNLEHIISLTSDQPAFIVDYNEELANVTIPKLERILSGAYVPVLFNNNSATLMKNPSYCYGIRNSVTDSDTWIVKFDGKVCEDVEKAAAAPAENVVKDKSSRDSLGIFMILALVAVVFNF